MPGPAVRRDVTATGTAASATRSRPIGSVPRYRLARRNSGERSARGTGEGWGKCSTRSHNERAPSQKIARPKLESAPSKFARGVGYLVAHAAGLNQQRDRLEVCRD